MYCNTYYDVKIIIINMTMDTENIKKEIGNRIKESRKYAQMTQSQVAEFLLMTQQQYSRFENGIFELSYSDLIKICKLFDVSADYLLGLEK